MITLIVNASLQYGIFPDQLKSAIVRPVLKKPNLDADDFKNYRPISNLTFLSKILEKCVHIQLVDYITKNKLFAPFQSGYRKNHSCETAVIKIHNDILLHIDKKTHVILMLLDLSAAFDTINHQLLLKRLHRTYKLQGNVISWIESYLSSRSFCVSVGNISSSESPLYIGVPQGSILGPLLFILYTKDLEKIAQKYGFTVHLYADDTQIYFSFDPKEDSKQQLSSLQDCFTEIRCWMTKNYLKLNSNKTEIMEFHSPYTSSKLIETFKLENCEIIPSTKAKNLGFMFDEHLNLNDQISSISKTCYINLRNLNRIGSKLSKNLKIQLAHSCIHSILDNANSTFAGLSNDQLMKLQKIQNAAVWFVFGLKGKDRYQSLTPFFVELHFLPVRYRILYKISFLVFKCLNNLAPQYLSSLIKLRDGKRHCVRLDDDFFLLTQPSPPSTAKAASAFVHSAPKTWNELPYSLRSMSELSAFKVALKTYYFKCAFKETLTSEGDMFLY